jgi:hypothetical protein
MRYILLSAILLFFVSCDEKNMKSEKSKESNNSMLLGNWRFEDDEFASMSIKKDSIYYPDHMAKSAYILRDKYLIVFGDSSDVDTFRYTFKGTDTLLLTIHDFSQKYN